MEEESRNEIFSTNIQIKIFTERVKILHKNLLVSIPANVLCATAAFVGLYHTTKNLLIFAWFAAVIFISLFRMTAYYFYYRHPQNALLHLSIFIVGVTISAGLWGVAGSIMMPKNDLLQQMIIIVIIAGVTAGGAQTLNASLAASLIYVSLIILPLCTWLFLQNGLSYLVLGIAMTTYLTFMLVTTVRGFKLLEKVLRLNYVNIELVESLFVSNKKLLQSYKTLKQHEYETVLLNKMNDMLQTCQGSQEAYAIIHFTAKELFAGYSGGLVILHSSTHTLETIKSWGDEQTLKCTFSVNDCWALRQGRRFFILDAKKELICYHFNSPPSAYFCLPLIIQNKSIGLLVIHTSLDNSLTEYQQQLAISFCESIQLSLANIKLRESLYDQSVHDPLTGLFNRRYLDETLPRELQRMIREKQPLCLAMIDIDFFKHFNDANGHEAGDELLKFIGILLTENFRKSDIACRFGGEEFLVVLVNSNLSAAYLRLELIRKTVKTAKIYFQNKLLPPITISIGIVQAPEEGTSVENIIKAADEALYAAKQAGRDRVVSINSLTQPAIPTDCGSSLS